MLKQIFKFIGVSGIGWIIDFTLYLIITFLFQIKVGYANFVSAIPAITFVFIVSTKKIFIKSNGCINLKYKYMIYCVYQIFLISIVSILGQYLYEYVCMFNIEAININQISKIGVKLIITPITMIFNFFIMKILIERY